MVSPAGATVVGPCFEFPRGDVSRRATLVSYFCDSSESVLERPLESELESDWSDAEAKIG